MLILASRLFALALGMEPFGCLYNLIPLGVPWGPF